jgi:hypothetical protein
MRGGIGGAVGFLHSDKKIPVRPSTSPESLLLHLSASLLNCRIRKVAKVYVMCIIYCLYQMPSETVGTRA